MAARELDSTSKTFVGASVLMLAGSLKVSDRKEKVFKTPLGHPLLREEKPSPLKKGD
jgi:hypothetical protein